MFYSSNQYSEDLPVFVVCFMSFLLLFSTCHKAWFLLSELEIEARCEMQFTCIGLGAPQTNGKTGRTRSQGCCFFLWGGVLLMCNTSLNQVSENFCLLLRPLPQETQLLLSHCLLKSLSHCILKRQSVSSPFSLSVSHKFLLLIKSQLYLVVISL